MTSQKKLRVTLVKSKFGRKPSHRACIEGLGLRHCNQTVEIEDTACTRGLIAKVAYLLKIEEDGHAS